MRVDNQIQKTENNGQLVLAKTGSKTYDGHNKRFAAWLIAENKEISKESIACYLAELAAQGKKPATVNSYKQAIKKALSLLATSDRQRAELQASFADMKIGKPDKKVTARKILSDTETEIIARNLSKHNRLAFTALQQSGLRVSELCNIRKADCTVEKEAVNIRVLGKGRKERFVYFTQALYSEILEACKCDRAEYLFAGKNGGRVNRSNLSNAIARAGSIAGVKASAHKLRHTFATKQIKANKGSVKAVSQYLGHATTAITESMYVHDELSAKEALRFAV